VRGVIEYAVRHRVTMLMITAAAVLFGVVSLGRLPLQLLPDLSYPTLTIQTEYPDSGPSEVENLITRPLEEAAGVIPGLRRIDSKSEPGLSEITLEFGWNTDMDFAGLDVREKIDLVTLPEDAGTPVILRYDPALDPVIRLGITGPVNQVQLRYLAEQVVKKELESLPGVAAAKVVGGLTEEVHVDVDEQRLAALGIPISKVADLVGAENVNASGGRLRDRDAEYLVRTLNQYTDADDVARTIVMRDGDKVVKLADVANVTRAYKEREIVTRIDGSPAVEVAIYKEGDANIVDTARRVRKALPGLQKILPNGVEARVLADQSTFIEAAIGQVRSNALIGGLLAILVLLVFLRDVRSTAIIALAIPVSIVTTFVLMFRQGVTLNVMSLGGLALGVGMLVDNSIVVLESIVRHRRMGGRSRADAVVEGTEEVAMAITASTLTTIAVFLPILFVEGVARQIFKDQALTVTYSLLVSLVVALTLTPMVAALGSEGKRRGWNPFRRRRPEGSAGAGITPLPSPAEEGGDPLLGPVYRLYDRVLAGALRRRAAVVTGTVVLFALAVVGIRALGMNLIPSFTRGEFRFSMELPEATPLERTDQVVGQLETELRSIPAVETVFSNVGLDAGESGSLRAKKENHAELNIHLHPGTDRKQDDAALAAIRSKLADFPDVTATLQQASAFTFKTPVAVEIYGYDLASLADVSNQVAALLKRTPGLKDVAMTMEPGDPEVQIRFDRDKLRLAGLGLRESAEALRTQVLGKVATDFKDRDREIDVRVRGEEAQSLDFAELPSLVVGYKNGIPIRLASVADVDVDRGPARIQRIAQSRAAVVSASLVGRDLGTVSRELEASLAGLTLPPHVTVQLAGQNDEMKRSLRSLLFAGALAVFLIYLVMACQFESLLDPFLIMFAVPLALIGVVGGLLVTGTTVSVVVLIGGIMLAGIVVNNGIVLVDLVGQLRRRGLGVHEALLEAGRTRLRPILMTTGTTVLGLVPLALGRGDGSELMAPLAVTVIGGLAVSTLLTLVFIPVLYTLVHRDGRRSGATAGSSRLGG
jgi:HAE1 family hydrophobic/amphiphilic exporter-1